MNTLPIQKFRSITLSFLVLVFLAACSAMPQLSTPEAAEREKVVAAAEPIADNLFEGMNNNDYQAFSRDFDDTMKKALNEKSFQEMNQIFTPKIGAYQSRTMIKVEIVDTIYVISYTAKFENEEKVSVRLNLRPYADSYQVAGLWFDSPKLRGK